MFAHAFSCSFLSWYFPPIIVTSDGFYFHFILPDRDERLKNAFEIRSTVSNAFAVPFGLRFECIKEYLLLEEEFIKNQECLKPREVRREVKEIYLF
jgi:hypothetical protein